MVSFREFWLAWRRQRWTFPSVQQWWDVGKIHSQLFCRSSTQGASWKRDVAIEQLELEVLQLERHLAASSRDPSLCGACREKWEELWALDDLQAQGAFVRSWIHLLQEMDHSYCLFYALEKRGS
ncbi:unnamed protein product [Caretta caretta]